MIKYLYFIGSQVVDVIAVIDDIKETVVDTLLECKEVDYRQNNLKEALGTMSFIEGTCLRLFSN